jgi:hypothetical protein
MVTGASDVAFEEQADMSLTASDVCKWHLADVGV